MELSTFQKMLLMTNKQYLFKVNQNTKATTSIRAQEMDFNAIQLHVKDTHTHFTSGINQLRKII